jgi:hypothetical protein
VPLHQRLPLPRHHEVEHQPRGVRVRRLAENHPVPGAFQTSFVFGPLSSLNSIGAPLSLQVDGAGRDEGSGGDLARADRLRHRQRRDIELRLLLRQPREEVLAVVRLEPLCQSMIETALAMIVPMRPFSLELKKSL